MMRTEYGLRYELVDKISEDWSAYDRIVAGIHLQNYGCIIIDTEYRTPIVNEHDLYVIGGLIRAAG